MNILVIVIICIVLFLIWKFLSKFKTPKVAAYALVTGAIKTGKTFFAVNLAKREYKRRLRSTKITNFIRSLFRQPQLDLPLLYSNIPLAIPYVPVTEDLILGKKRFVYGSVVLLSEASLVADSTTSKNSTEIFNEQLMLFVKLFGHETKGGFLVAETQSIADLNVNFKKNLTQYFYIHHLRKFFILPFVCAYVREERYSYDGSAGNDYNEDVEESLKKILCWKKVFNYYDCYCYSKLTDHLPVANNIVHSNILKADDIVSFKKFITIKDGKRS